MTDKKKGRPQYPWDEWARELGFYNEREMLLGFRLWGWSIDRIAAALGCGPEVNVPDRTAIAYRLRFYKIPTTSAARCNPGRVELRRQARLIARGGR